MCIRDRGKRFHIVKILSVMNGKPCAALDAALFSMFFFYELRKVQNFLQHFFGDFIVAFKQGEFQIVPADGRRCGGVCAEQVVCCNRQCIAQLSDGCLLYTSRDDVRQDTGNLLNGLKNAHRVGSKCGQGTEFHQSLQDVYKRQFPHRSRPQ